MGDGGISRDGGDGAGPPRTAAGALSRLIAEMVASPERDPETWGAGLRRGAVVAGRFELVRELGRGGFGIVFEARDRELKRSVAFKAIRRGPARRDASEELLRREADAIAQLQHPGIVTIHDVGRCDAGPYLVLELLRGETLAARLARGRLPVREALRVAAEIGRALEHAHARGVLHRDLKPSNVFLTEGGGVKVLDFGLAHALGAAGPSGSGTPGYMAPEQQRGASEDARTDVFAVGVLLRDMLAPRWTTPRAARAARPGLAAELAGLVAAASHPEPAGRPRDAAELVAAIARAEAVAARAAAGGRPERGPPLLLDDPAPGAGAATLEAYRWLVRAEECAARPVLGQDCTEGFRKAIALDPTLPAAHYGLAVFARWYGGSRALQRSAIREALRHAHRAGERDRVLIRAFAAQADGRDDEALAVYREAAARWPDDRRVLYELGDILRHRDEPALALPCFERVAALAPDSAWALGHLVEALGVLGRLDDLRGRVAGWEEAPTPATLHAASMARGWLGDVAAAAADAEQGAVIGGGIAAQEDLLGAAVIAGRWADAERLCRALAARGSGVARMGHYGLAAVEAYRGRRAAGRAWLDALRRAMPEVEEDVLFHAVVADYLAGDGDAGPVRAEVDALARLDPHAAAEHALTLAFLGDAPAAEALARGLRPGSALAVACEGALACERGEIDGGLARLRAVADTTPVVVWRLAPLFVLGALAARAGRDAEAIAALERFESLYVPRMMWRTWAHPRALLLLGEVHARAGDAARARGALGRLLAEWRDADPGDPLLARARELDRRVAR